MPLETGGQDEKGARIDKNCWGEGLRKGRDKLLPGTGREDWETEVPDENCRSWNNLEKKKAETVPPVTNGTGTERLVPTGVSGEGARRRRSVPLETSRAVEGVSHSRAENDYCYVPGVIVG